MILPELQKDVSEMLTIRHLAHKVSCPHVAIVFLVFLAIVVSLMITWRQQFLTVLIKWVGRSENGVGLRRRIESAPKHSDTALLNTQSEDGSWSLMFTEYRSTENLQVY